MNGEFVDKVKSNFKFLFDQYGFTIEEELYDPATFGNAYLIVSSPELKFRFVNDRGQLSVEIMDTYVPKWLNIIDIMELLNWKLEEPGGELSIINLNLEDYVLFIQKFYKNIIKLFNENNYKGTHLFIKEKEKKRVQQIFGNHVPS